MFNINQIKQLIVIIGALFFGSPIMGAAARAVARGVSATVTVVNKTGDNIGQWGLKRSVGRTQGNLADIRPIHGLNTGFGILSPNQSDVHLRNNITYIRIDDTDRDLETDLIAIDSLPAGDITLVFKLNPERDRIIYERERTGAECKGAREVAAAAAMPIAVAMPIPAAAAAMPAAPGGPLSAEDRLRRELKECREALAKVTAERDALKAEYEPGA